MSASREYVRVRAGENPRLAETALVPVVNWSLSVLYPES
jgi:hypothetical protein